MNLVVSDSGVKYVPPSMRQHPLRYNSWRPVLCTILHIYAVEWSRAHCGSIPYTTPHSYQSASHQSYPTTHSLESTPRTYPPENRNPPKFAILADPCLIRHLANQLPQYNRDTPTVHADSPSPVDTSPIRKSNVKEATCFLLLSTLTHS